LEAGHVGDGRAADLDDGVADLERTFTWFAMIGGDPGGPGLLPAEFVGHVLHHHRPVFGCDLDAEILEL
jgi:hypothetical protein